MAGIRVCLAGIGRAGAPLARGIARAAEFEFVAAVSRSNAGRSLAEVLEGSEAEVPVYGTVVEAFRVPCDVFVEYTQPAVAKGHALAALRAGAHVVVGTSGLTPEDYAEIDAVAREVGKGVLAVGNFTITAVLMQKFSEMAAKYIPSWEIIEYAHPEKRDAPSGTARELANRLSAVRESELGVPLEEVEGEREARGVRLQGSQVHSLRLPGHYIVVESVFGLPDERLIVRHESASLEPYVGGALLAIREVGRLVGVHRGLDSVMDL